MLRIALALPAFLALLALAPTATLASPASAKGLSELRAKVHHAKSSLKKAKTLETRIEIARGLRIYVARELDRQRNVTQPDATDDQLALTLIGYDEDLGSFIDEPQPDFSQGACAGARVALIHAYTPAGETREPANLPLHTQDSLDILNLLCGS